MVTRFLRFEQKETKKTKKRIRAGRLVVTCEPGTVRLARLLCFFSPAGRMCGFAPELLRQGFGWGDLRLSVESDTPFAWAQGVPPAWAHGVSPVWARGRGVSLCRRITGQLPAPFLLPRRRTLPAAGLGIRRVRSPGPARIRCDCLATARSGGAPGFDSPSILVCGTGR